jgi:hypothetical protein
MKPDIRLVAPSTIDCLRQMDRLFANRAHTGQKEALRFHHDQSSDQTCRGEVTAITVSIWLRRRRYRRRIEGYPYGDKRPTLGLD